jgi:protein TonB
MGAGFAFLGVEKMRLHWLCIAAIGIAVSAGNTEVKAATPQNDSSSLSTSAVPADDPAFAGFPPVTRDIKPPKAISAPDPKFPDLPEGAEQRGTVVMLIGVNAKGHVGAVHVLRSDEAAFEKTAVETVKKWKFKPAQKDGHNVPVQVTVEMKFER